MLLKFFHDTESVSEYPSVVLVSSLLWLTLFQQVQTGAVQHHEFYELVLNYYRARHQLLGAEHDIELLKQEVQTSTDQCWSTVEEKLVLQVSSKRLLVPQVSV